MIVPDTSVLVAAFAAWHESHAVADERLGGKTPVIAHTGFEFVSTLTRLPDPYRVGAAPALEFLRRRSKGEWIAMPPPEMQLCLTRSVAAGIRGGALYDALVGTTARFAGATLLSLDHRAVITYRALEIPYELVA